MAITVKCVRGEGDREAPPISDNLIVTEEMGIARGKRFLDDTYYTIKRYNMTVPHKGTIIPPESWVTITVPTLGLSQKKVKVKHYSVTITPESVWSRMDIKQYIDPEA